MPDVMQVFEQTYAKANTDPQGLAQIVADWRADADEVHVEDKGDHWLVTAVWITKEAVNHDTSEGGMSLPPAESAAAVTPPAAVAQVRRRVVEAAAAMIAADERGLHCWDWAHKVYLRAQATPRLIWPNGRYVLGSISRNIKDLPAYNAQENIARMHSLQSGDWIFINNRNRYDKLGNHSVIFLDWEAFPVAKVAQLPSGPHRPPNVGKYDLADMPLAHVSEPI